MKVLISLTSGLSDAAHVPAAGELTVDGNVLSLSWTQPAEGEETCGSQHHLSYGKPDGILHMKRTGDNTTDLTFSGSARTKGVLSTPYGDFSLEIETRNLFVPDELWQFAEEDADIFSREQKVKIIHLSYFLYFSGQDPMPNDIAIQISLVKNEDKR
ncbi:MAG: DUF1934 family protein [Eubacteriales bacterium]